MANIEKPRKIDFMMKRAFVAAPLIGTIIFLIAIMFAVNLSRTDASEVSHVVSDAYHNRIVSLLEMYRSDLGAVFTVGLSRNIESFLTTECWASEPFSISTTNIDTDGEILKAKYENCVLFNKILKAVVCSLDPRYGMKNWLSKMNESAVFEGVSFTPANKNTFERFINFGWGSSNYRGGSDCGRDAQGNPIRCGSSGLCDTLVRGSIFDCEAFARPQSKLQCCNAPDLEASTYTERKDCEARGGKVVDGCESGVFYVSMKIEHPDIFPSMPRISATDGLGNEIRSGALADRDFILPVNYPLFKYYGDAFTFYETLAKGTGSVPGVLDGLCYEEQPDACSTAEKGTAKPIPPGQSKTRKSRKTGVVGTVTEEVTSAAEVAAESNFVQLFEAAKSASQNYAVSLEENPNQFIETSDDTEGYLNNLVASGGLPYAAVDDPRLTVKFNDTQTIFQVSSEKQNQFCWNANPKYTG